MKAGDLVRYCGTGAVYLCLWSDDVWCKLHTFDRKFHIEDSALEVVCERG